MAVNVACSFLAGAAAVVFFLLCACKRLHLATPRVTRSDKCWGVQLHQVSPLGNSDDQQDGGVDIIAIHGLDTRSPNTWTFKEGGKCDVNWLADKHMLPTEVSNVRIFTCDWPAELFQTSHHSPDKIGELARLLLAGILGRHARTSSQATKDRPILFIASCLGGVILMEALVIAEKEYCSVREATRGVIFLATPFLGTSFMDVAKWAEPGLKAWASIQGRRVSGILGWVSQNWDLEELVRKFTARCLTGGPTALSFDNIFTFYEKQTTDLTRKVPLLGLLSYFLRQEKRVRATRLTSPKLSGYLLTMISWLIQIQRVYNLFLTLSRSIAIISR
jgi:hypothetical protein